jgi:uncharacterized membrane protein
MNKKKWFKQLQKHLNGIPKPERQRVLDFYEELFADKREAGIRESDILMEFGDPKIAALRIQLGKGETPPPVYDTPGYVPPPPVYGAPGYTPPPVYGTPGYTPPGYVPPEFDAPQAAAYAGADSHRYSRPPYQKKADVYAEYAAYNQPSKKFRPLRIIPLLFVIPFIFIGLTLFLSLWVTVISIFISAICVFLSGLFAGASTVAIAVDGGKFLIMLAIALACTGGGFLFTKIVAAAFKPMGRLSVKYFRSFGSMARGAKNFLYCR